MSGFRVPPGLDDGEWYHGSPLELDLLAAGCTITRCRVVAEAFSHKPTCLCVEEQLQPIVVCHNGLLAGHLYAIDETIGVADVRPHPNSSFAGGGIEWITNRPLRLRLIADLAATQPRCEDCRHRPAHP